MAATDSNTNAKGNEARQLVHLAPGEGETVRSPTGPALTFKLRGPQTGGSLAAWENVVAPGEGPPLHTHKNEDEIWYALEGSFRFTLGGYTAAAEPGAFVYIPRGVVHTWQNIGPSPRAVSRDPGAGRVRDVLRPVRRARVRCAAKRRFRPPRTRSRHDRRRTAARRVRSALTATPGKSHTAPAPGPTRPGCRRVGVDTVSPGSAVAARAAVEDIQARGLRSGWSLPSRPKRLSFPAPPVSTSSPAPPSMVSLIASAWSAEALTTSSPSSALIASVSLAASALVTLTVAARPVTLTAPLLPRGGDGVVAVGAVDDDAVGLAVAGAAAEGAGEVGVDLRTSVPVRSLTVIVSAPPSALKSTVSTSLVSMVMLATSRKNLSRSPFADRSMCSARLRR